MTSEIIPTAEPVQAENLGTPDDPNAPAIGRWYWYEYEDDKETKRDLVCVTHIGSNYVQVDYAGTSSWRSYTRIHMDEVHKVLTPEPDAEQVIARKIAGHQRQVRELMGQVQEITERLAIGTGPKALMPGAETQALALHGSGQPVEEYKAALAKAKEETLPELFKRIEKHNEKMAVWMKATLIPLQARVEPLKGSLKAIENRIFNVELYAGLVEQVVLIADGAPAPMGTVVNLFQRRCYMDEECLVNYEAGGMTFKHLHEFDAWLARPENRDRLLPLPRSVVAFRVRRSDAEREFTSFRSWVDFAFGGEEKADRFTYLYIRNGERLYRMCTEVDFGEKLFPDIDQAMLIGKLFAKVDGAGNVSEVITEGSYLARKAEYRRKKKEHEQAVKAWRAENAKLPKEERRSSVFEPSFYDTFDGKYQEYTPSNIFYDDITKHMKDEMDRHNRVVLILQGLFDRSPVFHPHAPVQLWSDAGFRQNVNLVYDDSRALVPGEAPDFEAYRTALNEQITKDSVLVGQDDFWARAEAVKENARARGSRYGGEYHRAIWHRPYGNPGPGELAKPAAVGKQGARFRWMRERSGRLTHYQRHYEGKSYNDRMPCTIVVPYDKLFNVSAYKKGDFKRFYADPRTRADYLKWAPYLLIAEDYVCGKRKVDGGLDSPPVDE